MTIDDIVRGVSLAFANAAEARSRLAVSMVREAENPQSLAICDYPPSHYLYREIFPQGKEVWFALSNLGIECLYEWADFMRDIAETQAKQNSAWPYTSHFLIERMAQGIEAGGRSGLISGNATATTRLACAVVEAHAHGERPFLCLWHTLTARAERGAISKHPKDVFHMRVCPRDSHAVIARTIAGFPNPEWPNAEAEAAEKAAA